MNRSAGITVPARQMVSTQKDCSCADTDVAVCDLETIIRPLFYCGQLLTDQDLNAFVQWVQQKERLKRFREGWGVVNGLQVHCNPERPGWVTVDPGYAISCCGDDILVCEPSGINLNSACRQEEDPCAEVNKSQKKGVSVLEKARSSGKRGREQLVVDIFINYREEYSDAQTVLGRAGCGESGGCEYSRAREAHELSWQPALPGSDPTDAEARNWQAQYNDSLAVLDEFIRMKNNLGSLSENGAALRNLLLEKIRQTPSQQLCFLYDQICRQSAEDFEKEENLIPYVFLLVQDRRNAFLFCPPYTCEENKGVRLARVYLNILEDEKGRRSCSVYSIDPYPPYRRSLQLDCLPAFRGMVNLGKAIWHRPEDACRMLSREGLCIDRMEDYALPDSLEQLRKDLDGPIMAGYRREKYGTCGSKLVIRVLDTGDILEGPRVVGFYEDYGEAPEPPSEGATDVKLILEGPQSSVMVGSEFTYSIRVENNTNSQLPAVNAYGTLPEGIGFKSVSDPGIGVAFTPSSRLVEMRMPSIDQVRAWDMVVTADAPALATPLQYYFELITQDGRKYASNIVSTTFDIEAFAGNISGLNKTHEKALRKAGIRTYADLAQASLAVVREAVGNLPQERMDAWIREAKDLAEKGKQP